MELRVTYFKRLENRTDVSCDANLSAATYAGHSLAGISVCLDVNTQRAVSRRQDIRKVSIPTASSARVKYLKDWAKRQRKAALSTGVFSLLVLPVFASSAAAQDGSAVNASTAENVVSAVIQEDGTLLLTMEDGSTRSIAEGEYSVSADGQIIVDAEAFAGGGTAVAGVSGGPLLGVLAGGAAIAGAGGGGSDGSGGGTATTTGFVIDGYISNATVFRDTNGNSVLDDGEVSTTTNAQGEFTLGGDPNTPIVSVGGTDISTGLPFAGTLTAPAGSTVVTPVTTLVQRLIELDESGETTVEQAITIVNEALGLDEASDLLNEDPIESGNDALFAAGAKIANVVTVGLAVGADETDVLDGLAEALLDPDVADDPLNNAGVLEDVFRDALEGETPNSDLGSTAGSVANANNVIDDRAEAGDTDGIADVQQVVQGDFSDDVKEGDVNEIIEEDEVAEAADDAEEIVDGRVQFDVPAFSEDFNGSITLAETSQDGAWYVDRSAPAAFEIFVRDDGSSVLRQTIAPNADDDNDPDDRPDGTFHDTQGRKYDLPDETTEISIQMYIDPAWQPAEGATSGFRQAGFWGSALNEGGEIAGFPIIEFSTVDGAPNFRVWTGLEGEDRWLDLGVPEDFQYGAFQDLSIAVNDDGSVTYTVGTLTEVVDSFDVVALDNVILQGHNYVPGDPEGDREPYDILWDNFEASSDAFGLIEDDVILSVFAENVDFQSRSYEVAENVTLTLTVGQADGLTVSGSGTVKLVGEFNAGVDLSGISAAIDATDVQDVALTVSADQADGLTIDLAEDATLTIDVDYADLSAENPTLTPAIDISGITVGGSSSPADLFKVLDAGSVGDTIKLHRSYGDNGYYDAFPQGNPDVNAANIELGNLYVEYLLDGGAPLLDIVQTRVSGEPDFAARQQSLHDNLLGNLGDAAVTSRLNSGQLLEDNRSDAAKGFGDRPLDDGIFDDNRLLLESQVWDVANGIPRADFTPGAGEIYVLNGTTLVDANDAPEDGFQPFTSLAEAGAQANDGAYIVIGPGTYEGDLDIASSVTVNGVGDVTINGGFRITPDTQSPLIVTMTGVDIVLDEAGDRGFYVRGDDVTLNLTETSVTGPDAPNTRGIETETGSDPVINVTGGSFAGLTTGIYLNPEATLTVDGTVFTGNLAGIGTDAPAGVTVTNATFDGNGEAIGFGINVTNDNVTLSGNTYVTDADQVLAYLPPNVRSALPDTLDGVAIVRVDQQTINGTDGNDIVVDPSGSSVIDLSSGGSDFVLFVSNGTEEGVNHLLGFSAGAVGEGGDVLAFTSGSRDLPDLRGMTVETLAEGGSIGADTGFILFTTEVSLPSSFAEIADGLSSDELAPLLAAVDSLTGAESGNVLIAVSDGEDTLIFDADLDETVADGDRVSSIAYLEGTAGADLTAENLYDFSAVTANT